MATLDVRVTNNATTKLFAGIIDSAGTLTVTGGEGQLFPVTSDDIYFYVTLQKASGAWEIVRVTERATDTFTITRNVDSSTGSAMAFDADDIVSLRPCADVIQDIIDWINDTNGVDVILPAPAGTKLIFYQASAPPGWTTDAAVADCVLAFKGGSEAYDDVAGTLVGSWTQPNHTHPIVHTHELDHTHDVSVDEHNHQIYDFSDGAHYDADGTSLQTSAGPKVFSGTAMNVHITGGDGYRPAQDVYTANGDDVVSSDQPDDATTDSQSTDDSQNGAPVNTYRPYAALCIQATRDA